jgi:hypothetical protein
MKVKDRHMFTEEKFKDAWSKSSYRKKKVFSIFYVDKYTGTNSIKVESILKAHNASPFTLSILFRTSVRLSTSSKIMVSGKKEC